MAATIKDVAKRAGVSAKTVSRVLNQEESVRADTRQRVQDAVESLGYTRHQTARELRTQRSDTIGFITDEIATSPFAADVVKGAQDEALKHGRLLLVVNTDRDRQVEARAVESMRERRVDGVIYAAMFHRELDPDPNLRHLPTVLVDGFDAHGRFDAVVPDEVQGGRLATQTLIDAGHRRVAFINLDPVATPVASAGRLQGYQDALQASGILFDKTLVKNASTDPQQGYALTHELLQLPDPPTAIFAGNDRTAVGVYCAVYEAGLKIPGDVAVIGFDDQREIAEHLTPPLTTIALPHLEMGRRGVQQLLERLSHNHDTPNFDPPDRDVTRLACPIVTRASV